MLFNSHVFVVFLILVYSLYRILSHKGQNVLLLISSYVFYGWWDYRFLSLIAISTLIDFFCGKCIARTSSPVAKKRWLTLSVCCNLGLLGFFKYYNFFVDSFAEVLMAFGIQSPWHLNIVLPVGISFYTFQTMSYTIDIYRDKLAPTENLLDFAVFVAFFPQLVAGPIERAVRLLPQISTPRRITWRQSREGLELILWGYFKKVFVADNLAILVNQIFAMDPSSLNFWYVVLGCYAFAFQIYGDFSGYSDIAKGVSKLLGIELMRNFKAPYLAKNPAEFWRHWHISLSSWLRDYLYISLGGNRRGHLRTHVNLALTMILGGLWHGAAWNFVWWGIYQGMLLVVFRGLRDRRGESWFDFAKCIATFQFTCLGWLIFRATSGTQILDMLRMLLVFEWPHSAVVTKYAGLLFFSFFLICEQYYKLRYDSETGFEYSSPMVKYCVYFYLIVCTVFLAAPGAEQFIYFQF